MRDFIQSVLAKTLQVLAWLQSHVSEEGVTCKKTRKSPLRTDLLCAPCRFCGVVLSFTGVSIPFFCLPMRFHSVFNAFFSAVR